ncbi:hypothetical protein MNV49_001876 [Pseudohyphozyma bogoriensis]|nr:hypothetical protein MNV49_001876 [Pseudohyphozyma bogoriensis]
MPSAEPSNPYMDKAYKEAGRKQLPSPKRVLFRPLFNTVGGGLSADIYLPSSSVPASGYPVAIYIHGGGVVIGDTQGILRAAHQAAHLLAAGIAVVSIEYRLQPHVTTSEICGDVMYALEWVRGQRGPGLAGAIGAKVDGERVAVWGHSSGGQLSSWLGLSANPPLRAVIDGFGYNVCPLDLKNETPALIEARNKVLPLPAASSTKDMDDDSWINSPDQGERDRLAYAKALFAVGNTIPEGFPTPLDDPYSLASTVKSSPPFLILHGTADEAVPLAISEKFHDAMIKNGHDSTLVKVEGAGHGWKVEKGGEGRLGERWEIDEKAFKWFAEKILA